MAKTGITRPRAGKPDPSNLLFTHPKSLYRVRIANFPRRHDRRDNATPLINDASLTLATHGDTVWIPNPKFTRRFTIESWPYRSNTR